MIDPGLPGALSFRGETIDLTDREMVFSIFDRHRIDIECPRCRFPTRAFLRQIRRCDVLVCGGCKGNIQLVDHYRKTQ